MARYKKYPHLVTQEIDTELVLYHPLTEKAHCLKGDAVKVYRALKSEGSWEDLPCSLPSLPPQLLNELFGKFVEKGLIELDEQSQIEVKDSRRSFLRQSGLVGTLILTGTMSAAASGLTPTSTCLFSMDFCMQAACTTDFVCLYSDPSSPAVCTQANCDGCCNVSVGNAFSSICAPSAAACPPPSGTNEPRGSGPCF